MTPAPLIVLLNGPLGIGKSTLGEALGEAIDRSVILDGDSLVALNPPPTDEPELLHHTIVMLLGHYFAAGYDRFVISHYWSSAERLSDLESLLRSVMPDASIRCFRLTLPIDENLRRIARRQSVRAIDESAYEAATFADESRLLSNAGAGLGEPFDISDPPQLLVGRMLALLGLPVPSCKG